MCPTQLFCQMTGFWAHREDGVHCYRFAGMIVHLRGADGGICSICVCVCVNGML